MKLKVFTPANAPHIGAADSFRPFITISHNGVFHLSKNAIALLQLKEKDHVQFCQDEQYPSDWYIRQAPTGFPIESLRRHVTGFRSSTLRAVILESTGAPSDASFLRFYCSLTKDSYLQLDVKHPEASTYTKPSKKKNTK